MERLTLLLQRGWPSDKWLIVDSGSLVEKGAKQPPNPPILARQCGFRSPGLYP